jgi:predicted MFS family arabinose efflux permease
LRTATSDASWSSCSTSAKPSRPRCSPWCGLGSVSYNTARLVGPAVGGGLVAAIGPGPCFAINALSYFAVIFMVATLPASAGAAPRRRTRIRAAVSEARLDPILRGLILGAVLFSILVAPVQELAPAIARRHGDGAHLLGFLLTALAAGGLVGNVVRARLDRRGVPAEKAIGGSIFLCAAMLLVVRRLRTTSSSSPQWWPAGPPGTCSTSTASRACSSPTPGCRG